MGSRQISHMSFGLQLTTHLSSSATFYLIWCSFPLERQRYEIRLILRANGCSSRKMDRQAAHPSCWRLSTRTHLSYFCWFVLRTRYLVYFGSWHLYQGKCDHWFDQSQYSDYVRGRHESNGYIVHVCYGCLRLCLALQKATSMEDVKSRDISYLLPIHSIAGHLIGFLCSGMWCCNTIIIMFCKVLQWLNQRWAEPHWFMACIGEDACDKPYITGKQPKSILAP